MNENGNVALLSVRARVGRVAELAIGEADHDLTTIGNAIGDAIAADLGAGVVDIAGCHVPAGILRLLRDQGQLNVGLARRIWGDDAGAWQAGLLAQVDAETRDE